MQLEAGSRLGSYEILAPLGTGGMGEVYRARDARLRREVALKVLPDAVSNDRERTSRFEREAQVLATINHPCIASIYGFVEHNGSLALVMELVEGPTLAEVIAQGPIPVEEALPIARKIAEALEYAHERGIIHRDLKPANIKIMTEGQVKVLDFGLAKVVESEATQSDILSSPTLTTMATKEGFILGTAAYMSPEQAKGKAVDRRGDIWAFGCVVYEMLTGSPPFHGETVTDTLAAIVRAEPDWSLLPPSVLGRVKDLLQRCLRKDLRQRLQSIGDARVVLEEVSAGGSSEGAVEIPGAIPKSRPKWLIAVLSSLVLVLAAACLALFLGRSTGSPTRPALAAVLLSEPDLDEPAVSPDGRTVAFIRANKLWVRNLDELEARALDGTDEARAPFWSPDSKSIGYFQRAELRKILATGGVSGLICALSTSWPYEEATWGAGDRIIVSTGWEGLFEVPAQGGELKLFTRPNPAQEEIIFRDPRFLSDGNTLVMAVRRTGEGLRLDTIAVQRGADRKIVLQLPGAVLHHPVISESTGHLLFAQDRPNPGIWAVPFSNSTLKTMGTPFLVQSGGSAPSVSNGGILVFLAGLKPGSGELIWVDRAGKVLQTFGSAKDSMRDPAIAPDGVRVAVNSGPYTSVWVQDSARNTAINVSATVARVKAPTWTSDGKKVVFPCGADDSSAICLSPADGSGVARRVAAGVRARDVSLSRDGKSAVFSSRKPNGNLGISYLALQEDAKPEALLSTQANATLPQISPDGRFLAYQSDESGRYIVRFVVPMLARTARPQACPHIAHISPHSNGSLHGLHRHALGCSGDGEGTSRGRIDVPGD